MFKRLKPQIQPTTMPRLTKKARFALIIISALIITAVVSAVVRTWVLDGDRHDPLVVAVVAPLSGTDAAIGRAIRQGADLRASLINAAGGLSGRPLEVRAFDDKGDAAASRALAQTVAEQGDVLAVIGHHPDSAADAAGVYATRGVPLLEPNTMVDPGTGDANPWLFRTNFDTLFETRFLANYIRNVIGEPTIAVVRADTPQTAEQTEQFDRIIQRFGTKLVAQWTFAPGSTDLQTLAADVKQKMPTGALVILGSPADSAQAVVALRDANVRNLIGGLSGMASSAFRARLVELADKQAPEAYANGLLVSSPILFDTANERAQSFYGQYEKRFRAVPDWAAAMGDDSLALIADAIGQTLKAAGPEAGRTTTARQVSEQVRTRLADRNRTETAFQGVLGSWIFNARGQANIPVMMAVYNGLNPVAALTQLQPIREVGVSNFLEEVQRGRALYVNDRFMYKTNVIYTGVQMNEIRDLNPDKNEATVNATVWFRYRGNFNPADVVFVNAVKPIDLGKPYREERDDTMTYAAYRIEGRFTLDFLDVRQPFGSKVAGLSFRHRTLNRNNVMFVTDVLGMGLIDTSDFVEKLKAAATVVPTHEPTLLERLSRNLEGQAEGSALLERLRGTRVLAASPGWRLSRAWISQDVVSISSEGDPNYVGFGRPAPDFSRVDFGVMAVPDGPAARDVIDADHFLTIAIFAAVLALFARLMDRKDRGQFWKMQTLFMRILSWPLLLMSVGNIALDRAVASLPPSGINAVVNTFDVLWLLVPAFLATQTLERFVWTPLEVKTQRKIPGIIRRFASIIIFGLALCGVIAFVLKQPLTSLLAASGLISMVIGLAIQANIANIFSGIILNLERPFKIGDSVQITDVVKGVVVDMTWRTVRVRNGSGYTVAMPNGKVSESTVVNFSAVERVWMRLEYYADPAYDPDFMGQVLTRALAVAEGTMPSAGGTTPFVRYDGMRNSNGQWLAKYNLIFWVKDYDATFTVPEKVWKAVYATLRDAGLEPSPPDLLDAMTAAENGGDAAVKTAAATAVALADAR